MYRAASRALAALLVLVVFGCSAAPLASPSPSTSSAWDDTPQTPWQAELDNLPPDGIRTLDSGLRLFAMAFGPIPGVDAPVAEPGTVGSATPAVGPVVGNLDQLTADQRTAVEGYMQIPDSVKYFDVPPAGSSPSSGLSGAIALAGHGGLPDLGQPVAADEPLDTEIRADAAVVVAYMTDLWGDIPHIRIGLGEFGDRWASRFVPLFVEGEFKDCTVLVDSNVAGADRIAATGSLTLEIVHCYQAWKMGNESGFDGKVPEWAWNGPAAYVAMKVWPDLPAVPAVWVSYLKRPDRSLFIRNYDAAGYYFQIEWDGLDIADAMEGVLIDADNPDQFTAAGTVVDEFLESWASEQALLSEWGHDWSLSFPGIPTDRPPAQDLNVDVGSIEAVSQDAYSNHLHWVRSRADLVHFEFVGRPRLGDGNVDTTLLADSWFCTNDDACQPCQNGQILPFPTTRLAPSSVLAVSGGTDGTEGTVSGHDKDEFCKETPQPTTSASNGPPEPTRCAAGCAMSNGDPHIGTVDGGYYDFQAAGEFVLLRSPDDGFELQTRQQPHNGSDNVTQNSAVAMRLGSHRLSATSDRGTGAMSVLLDGQAVSSTTTTEVEGHRIIPTSGDYGTDYDIDFADGNHVLLLDIGFYGINIVVDPTTELRQTGRGVMASIPEGSDLPALPDGTTIPTTTDARQSYQALYIQFADAWRVTPEESLFDYQPGETTAKFTIAGFPHEEDLIALSDLTETQLAAGEAACVAIVDPVLHDQCVYDVGVTADPGFATGYERVLTIVDPSALTGSGASIRLVNTLVEANGPVDVDIYAYALPEGQFEQVAALVAHVPYGTASAWFDPGVIDSFGSRFSHWAIFRAGTTADSILDSDSVARELTPGMALTVSLAGSENFDGDLVPSWTTFVESGSPDLPTNPEPLADLGLIEAVGFGLPDLDDDFAGWLYVSSGTQCLSSATGEIGGGPQPISPTSAAPLGIEPGAHQLHINSAFDADGGLANSCHSPVGEPLPLTIAAGERVYVFMFAPNENAPTQTLLLPFGN